MNWRLIPILLLSSSAYALFLEELSFDDRVRLANVVVIGTVEKEESRDQAGRPTLALVKVESILKGTVPNTVCVLTRHPDAERSFKVIVGRRYLFLLVQRQDCYDSVNGHFGVIPVDGKPD